MFDPAGQTLQTVAARGAWAPVLAFGTGILSSAGPCAAPRMIAISAIVSNCARPQAVRVVCTFAGGLIFAYASFAAAASFLSRAAALSEATYGIVAVLLAACGIRTLWREHGACRVRSIASHANLGAVFLLGGSFALVLSPCCTPLVAGILAYTAAQGAPLYGSLLLACFAAGHSAVLFCACAGSRSFTALIQRCTAREAAAMVSGTLMLALAAYYGVLA